MNVLILHGEKVNSKEYKDALCKKYKFLKDSGMYTLKTHAVNKKLNKKFDKLYIDALSISHVDERVLKIIAKSPNATVIWIGKHEGKMKASFTSPVTKLGKK